MFYVAMGLICFALLVLPPVFRRIKKALASRAKVAEENKAPVSSENRGSLEKDWLKEAILRRLRPKLLWFIGIGVTAFAMLGNPSSLFAATTNPAYDAAGTSLFSLLDKFATVSIIPIISIAITAAYYFHNISRFRKLGWGTLHLMMFVPLTASVIWLSLALFSGGLINTDLYLKMALAGSLAILLLDLLNWVIPMGEFSRHIAVSAESSLFPTSTVRSEDWISWWNSRVHREMIIGKILMYGISLPILFFGGRSSLFNYTFLALCGADILLYILFHLRLKFELPAAVLYTKIPTFKKTHGPGLFSLFIGIGVAAFATLGNPASLFAATTGEGSGECRRSVPGGGHIPVAGCGNRARGPRPLPKSTAW
jgi:hypothetical protein